MSNLPTDLYTYSECLLCVTHCNIHRENSTKFTSIWNCCPVAKHPVFEDPDSLRHDEIKVCQCL